MNEVQGLPKRSPTGGWVKEWYVSLYLPPLNPPVAKKNKNDDEETYCSETGVEHLHEYSSGFHETVKLPKKILCQPWPPLARLDRN